jgi:polyisoprenoid-binding protein YceI
MSTSQTTTAFGTTQIPGYRPGTWTIDQVHSDVSFTVRHMMVSKVRGHFGTFSGEIVTGEEPSVSSATAQIDLASVDTNNDDRDNHLRSADFLDVEHFPGLDYHSTGVRTGRGGTFLVDGELSLHGVTRPVTLEVEINGFGPDPFGGYRAGFSATTEIRRSDFGVDINMPMDGGGVVVGDLIKINLEIEAVLKAA